ncbi:syndecan-2 [Dicentrarchus labrax]|uniref:Syndecan n=1 Tax=Dicentrarchus labrax TaxID=13489 RepID=A0A8P4G7D4_DICLA|nr:syndecan-2 [Dicentrarchus labrax]XP_051262498.1 syndecan-2 [Dicentrarchus labrax]
MRNLRLLFLVGLATGFVSEKLFVSSQSPFSTADDLYLEGRTSGDLPIDDEDGEDDGSGSGSGDYVFPNFTEEKLMRFLNLSRTTVSKETVPNQPQPTADSPHDPPTTAADSQDPPTTMKDSEETDEEVAGIGPTADWFTQKTSVRSTRMPPSETTTAEFSTDISVTKDTDEDNSLDRWDATTPKDNGDGFLMSENEILVKNGHGGRLYEMDSPKEVSSENLWERTEVLAAVIACGVVGFLCAVFLLLLLAYRMKKKDEGSYDLGDTKLSTTTYHKAPTKEFYA